MFCDYHTHTEFSDDSTYIMEDCVRDAIKIGMKEICFTDHVDYGIKYDVDELKTLTKKELNVDYNRYFQEIERLQEKYKNQMTIKKGLEFGIQYHTIEKYQSLFHRYALDFVILSIHQVDDKEFWTYEFQKGKTEKEYYQAYFDEMYKVVQNYHDYSVLGHMDMLKRYDDKDCYDVFYNHKDIITKILEYVIKDGKGIELNTSFIRYGLDDSMPSQDILKLYLELGGKILTIGSDSHSKTHLCHSHIEELKEMLKEIGFKYYCTFENMKPIYHKL